MQEIDEKILSLAHKIVEQQFTSPLESVSQIHDKGEVNQVYVLTLKDSQKYVLRLNSKSELQRFKKEKWCADVTQAEGVAGAKVIDVGVEQDSAYLLLGYIGGSNGSDIKNTPELWRQLGGYLKIIHSVPATGFGENLDDIQGRSRKSWERYLNYNIDSLNNEDELVKTGVLNKSTSAQLRILFQGIFVTDFKFGLNHGDYSLANIIVNPKGIPYVIDWGSAHAHVVPHYDMSVIIDESLKDDNAEFVALLTGYGLSQADYSAMRDDIKKLQLLESVDKLRWAIDRSPETIEHFKGRVMNFLKNFEIE